MLSWSMIKDEHLYAGVSSCTCTIVATAVSSHIKGTATVYLAYIIIQYYIDHQVVV